MDQNAFADAVGVDQGTVSKWENGRALPEWRAYARLALMASGQLRAELLTDGGPRAHREADALLAGAGQLQRLVEEGGSSEVPWVLPVGPGRGRSETPGPEDAVGWDRELAALVVTVAANYLNTHGQKLPIEQFGRLVALLYEFSYRTGRCEPSIVGHLLKRA